MSSNPYQFIYIVYIYLSEMEKGGWVNQEKKKQESGNFIRNFKQKNRKKFNMFKKQKRIFNLNNY